jgi:tRNA(Ile)-lysidine synthase
MDLPTPHTFIVAVSGGVDSCVLLHMIKHHYEGLSDVLKESPHIIVAHVDHGIRDTSERDRLFVENLAKDYDYEFETIQLSLGENASEEEARNARYEFLDTLVSKYHADAVVTAHHKDDVLETAVINITRGTGRRGLSSLRSRSGRARPLLEIPKSILIDYAKSHGLEWHDDETNTDQKYLRNRIRTVLKQGDDEWKDKFATHLQKITHVNDLLDTQIATVLQYKLKGRAVVSRNWFVKLDHQVACEFMASFLRREKIQNIDKKLIETLVIGLKAAKPGTKLDIDKTTFALITKRSLRLIDRKTLRTRIV